jgi:hypothetical protein
VVAGSARGAAENRLGRITALAACGLLSIAVVATVRLAVADHLFRAGNLDALSRATRIDSGNAQYHAWLAEYQESEGLDPDPELAEASRLNPLDSTVLIRRGLRAEFLHDFAASEKLLLEAARVDHLFDPRAALANFYFRRNRPDPFWQWTAEALAVGYGDLTSLFRLCWRVTDDPEVIRSRARIAGRKMLRQYLNFLLQEDQPQAALTVARQLAPVAEKEDTRPILDLIDRQAGQAFSPIHLEAWNTLCARNLLPFSPIRPGALTNADFRIPITSRGFDWRVPETPEITAVRLAGGGLRIDLTGRQPEQTELLAQFVPLPPGQTCRLRFRYQTSGFPPESGVAWKILEVTSPPLSSPGEISIDIAFPTHAASLARLALGYRRLPGTTRLEGSITLRRLALECAR